MLFPRTGPGAQFVLPPSCNDMSQKVIFKLCVQIKKKTFLLTIFLLFCFPDRCHLKGVRTKMLSKLSLRFFFFTKTEQLHQKKRQKHRYFILKNNLSLFLYDLKHLRIKLNPTMFYGQIHSEACLPSMLR